VDALLAAADLLVSPARYEPYGLNVQEALCRGVPALVSGSAGIAERYPSDLRELILADPEDDRELASRLRSWRSAIPAWKTKVTALGEILRGRSWPEMARDIVTLAERDEIVSETTPTRTVVG
jgi:glycosyltransferase involved in cell wall biosynthesis